MNAIKYLHYVEAVWNWIHLGCISSSKFVCLQ